MYHCAAITISVGVTNIEPSGKPQLNQVSHPWMISKIRKRGYETTWMYENT